MTEDSCPGRLQARILGSQPGNSRGAWSGDPVLQWKLNLSALSQCDDLYFVALHDSIYVDRPNLAADPLSDDMVSEFRWKLPTSDEASKATHHHHARYPHGVNHLVIGELGDDEVLGCACDDGDILVYLISSISSAFEAINEGSPQENVLERYVKPLYHYNVDRSAWGLAFQKEAYLIATGSNLAEVTIKAISLSNLDSEKAFRVPKLQHPDNYGPNFGELDRSLEETWNISQHLTNIPDVKFYCTKDEEPIIYLLSSDINGDIVILNVTTGCQNVCTVSINYDTHDTGWLVFPIGLDVFRIVHDEEHVHRSAKELQCTRTTSFVPRPPSWAPYESPLMSAGMSYNGLEKTVIAKLPFSIIHTSTERIEMLHAPFDRVAGCLKAPWRHATPPFIDHHGTSGTMRYARFIPELGIIVAGSHLGHIGIFTLTRLDRELEDNGGLGLRLDQILPFEEQIPEQNRMAGFSGWGALLGIATAPVPGSVKGRYRLVLEYSNRTLLSYELWRDSTLL